MKKTMIMCSRCIYDEQVPSIDFDENGICNYCHQVERLKREFGTGDKKGINELKKIVSKIKLAGAGKKYDCVIGVSGGTDSSYLACWALDVGLRPLAVHYDNTWNSAIATSNIFKVLSKLNIDLHTHVVKIRKQTIFLSHFSWQV